jgi:hypothetical protein
MFIIIKMEYQTTFDWLKNELVIVDENNPNQYDIIIRDNKVLSSVARMKKNEHILVIYKSDNEYCAHSFDEHNGWLETDPPMFGYFDIDLTWNELLQQIANKYYSIRNSLKK